MIASHSSSFIRSSRLSRVMPALLTRIVIGAELLLDLGEQRRRIAAASVTSSRRPAPAWPAAAR